MRSIEVDGPSLDEAIGLALDVLGVARDRVVVDVISGASAGSHAGPVRVRVALSSAASDGAGVVSRETTDPSPTPDPAGSSSFPGKQSLMEVFSRVASELGVRPRVNLHEREDAFVIEVEGDGADVLIGRNGHTLEALEYLLSRVAGHDAPRVVLDVEGYRERREHQLVEMAHRVADQVHETGRALPLDPMSPRERRIVHVALDGDVRVRTESEGGGVYKVLVIKPGR